MPPVGSDLLKRSLSEVAATTLGGAFLTGFLTGFFLIGATVIILVKLWLTNKRYGQIGLAIAAIAGTPVALAVINVGPLASKLYQGTLKNRFDYWNAAMGMFKDHPIFGVGIGIQWLL